MSNQQKTSRFSKPIPRTILLGLGIVILVTVLNRPTRQLPGLFYRAAEHALVLLPSFALTASQALEPDIFGPRRLSLCGLQTLVFWSLLESVAKVV